MSTNENEFTETVFVVLLETYMILGTYSFWFFLEAESFLVFYLTICNNLIYEKNKLFL